METKIDHNSGWKNQPARRGESNMRLVVAAFMRPIVALAVVVAVTLPSQARKSEAKNSNISSAAATETSSRCNASQIGPDGTWVQVPCREVGAETAAPPKAASGSDGEGSR
jgi:hypothetical protein